MSVPAIDRVTEILETAPEFYVPIKKLWLMLQAEGLVTDTDLSAFQALLEADDRFEFAAGIDFGSGFEDGPELAASVEAERAAFDFFGGPWVKLVARKMTQEDVFAALARHLQQMNEALLCAWGTRPDDPEVEDGLIDLLLAGQQLGREVNQLLAGEYPEDVMGDAENDQPGDMLDGQGER